MISKFMMLNLTKFDESEVKYSLLKIPGLVAGDELQTSRKVDFFNGVDCLGQQIDIQTSCVGLFVF